MELITNTDVTDILDIDKKWDVLEKLCVNEPQTFMNQISQFDPYLLNHARQTIHGTTINLFGVGIREKNYALVKFMLEND